MNDQQFAACRTFLEERIQEGTEHQLKFLEAYVELVKLKSMHDTQTNKAVIEKEIKLAEANERRETAGLQAQAEVRKNYDSGSFGLQQCMNSNAAATQQNWDTNQAGMHNTGLQTFAGMFNGMANNGLLGPR